MTTVKNTLLLIALFVVEAVHLERYDNLKSLGKLPIERVVEAVHLERYDNVEESNHMYLNSVVEAVHLERYDNPL